MFWLLLSKVGFGVHTVRTHATRSFYVHFAKKKKGKREKGIMS